MNENSNGPNRRTWRSRLAALTLALGTSVALTSAAPAQASVSSAPDVQGAELRSQKRFRKLVFRRGNDGGLRIADHTSHESHASHASHSSHMSGGHSG